LIFLLISFIVAGKINKIIGRMENSKPKKSLYKNSIYYLFYNVLNIAFPFVISIYVARVLLPDSVGIVATAQNLAQYFVLFSFLGIPTYGLREIAKIKDNKAGLNQLFSELFFINLISTICFSGLYLALIFSVPAYRSNYLLYLIVGGTIAGNALNISWLYEGLEEFGFISLRNLLLKIAVFVCLLIFVKGPEDYLTYAMISVLGTVGNYFFDVVFSPKFVHLTTKNLNFKRHAKSIFYLTVVNLAIELYSLTDITMIGIFCEPKNVAYYSYASRIQKICLQIINTFTIVIIPRLSEEYKEGKTEVVNQLITNALLVIFILALPMIIGLFFVSDEAVLVLFGSEYQPAAIVLKILSLLLLISPVGYLLGSRVLLIVGKEKLMGIPVGIGALVNVIGNYFLIQQYNEIGAAIASIISELVVMMIYIFMGRKYYKLGRWIPSLLKVVGGCLAMTALLIGLSYCPLSKGLLMAIEIAGGIILYFSVLLIEKETVVLSFFKKITTKIACKIHKKKDA
jgi:O-antigen/teichoic acid export membrane protein